MTTLTGYRLLYSGPPGLRGYEYQASAARARNTSHDKCRPLEPTMATTPLIANVTATAWAGAFDAPAPVSGNETSTAARPRYATLVSATRSAGYAS